MAELYRLGKKQTDNEPSPEQLPAVTYSRFWRARGRLLIVLEFGSEFQFEFDC